jgi:hypothetical protein
VLARGAHDRADGPRRFENQSVKETLLNRVPGISSSAAVAEVAVDATQRDMTIAVATRQKTIVGRTCILLLCTAEIRMDDRLRGCVSKFETEPLARCT